MSDETPRRTYLGSFDSEGLNHLVVPSAVLDRASEALAAGRAERLAVGDHVAKTSGDYAFAGVVMAAFVKRDGKTWRYVVENADGLLHVFSPAQLSREASP